MNPELFPTGDEYKELLTWCNNAFIAADEAREPQAKRWRRYYKLYRSYIERPEGEWRSMVFLPHIFTIIETVAPKLVAELPKFVCEPVGPDDVVPAKNMEVLLQNAAEQSDLYAELVAAYKSSLMFGTGILKTFWDERKGFRTDRQPQMIPLKVMEEVPTMDPDTGEPMVDLDGNPMMDQEERIGGYVQGPPTKQKTPYTKYEGPAAECIDTFNFYVAPEAHDIESARYVIHRCYKEMSEILEKVEEGIYVWPDNMTTKELADVSEEPHLERLDSVGLGASATNNDPTRSPVEILEFWTKDGRVITMANRKAILRVDANPFDHSEKPFVRIIDQFVPHEFWGIGEVEPVEGLQDLQNALVNQRIDNIRLTLNAIFAVNVDHLWDTSDLVMRPGQVIRLKGDLRPAEVIERVDLGDITSSAFSESQITEAMIEKASAVSAYQTGTDNSSLADTATGVAMIQEMGASRFSMKSRMAELLGLRALGRQFGSLIQQFTDEPKTIRMTAQNGIPFFQTFDPEALMGALDYSIEPASATQTPTMRVEQRQNLLGIMAQYNPMGVIPALEEVLDAMGIKDKQKFFGMGMIPPTPGLTGSMDPLEQQIQQQQQLGGAPGAPGAQPPPQQGPPQQGPNEASGY